MTCLTNVAPLLSAALCCHCHMFLSKNANDNLHVFDKKERSLFEDITHFMKKMIQLRSKHERVTKTHLYTRTHTHHE